LIDSGLDINEVVDRLAQEQQELCEALGIHSVSELARCMGMARSTLDDRVRKLRCALENNGLRAYAEYSHLKLQNSAEQ
jgi:Mn-dependent DtxR family transcriptional regulator